MILKLGATLLAVIMGMLSAGTVALLQGGVATVYVENEEVDLWIPVPMAAVELAVRFVPEKELAGARRDIEPYKELITLALNELISCPDVVLVEVEAPGESVLVKKEGGNLIVDVQGTETVRVKIPLDSAQRIIDAIAGPSEISKS
ncbi:MAG: hypothetical protein JSU96_10045 [Acidobacteriota bacterium]|nr:MAG: hypothetical protein JSU96_10045 [Acidobacteriota bacterium]